MLAHEIHRPLHDAGDARRAHEHVMRFLPQHELRGPREWIERRLGQRRELELAVAVGEVGEEEERQPVGRRLVEHAEDTGPVDVAGMPFEHLVGLVSAVATEVRVEQVHHRPEVAAFLDVDLQQVAQVVDARRGAPELALLLDGGRFRVALHDHEAPEVGAVLARHLLPHRLAVVIAEADRPIGHRVGEEDSPPVVGKLHVVELRQPS